ncbi:hypothetical protein D3C72_1947930 [compost metagenome]
MGAAQLVHDHVDADGVEIERGLVDDGLELLHHLGVFFLDARAHALELGFLLGGVAFTHG